LHPLILAQQPPHRPTSSQSMPSGTTKTPADDVPGRVRPEPLRGEEEAPSKASQMPGNPSRLPTNKKWVHRDPPHLIEDKEESSPPQHITPHTPHGTARYTSTPPRSQRGSSQREPTNREELRRLQLSSGSQLTSSVNDERWRGAIQIVTPSPQRGDRSSHTHILDASPSSWINATPYGPSLSLRGEEVQQTNVEQLNGARYNGMWIYDDNNTTNRRRRKLITQYTFLSRLGTIQESRAERRRLLTTTIDHFMYEVILWNTI
jgi:hypothetical protein